MNFHEDFGDCPAPEETQASIDWNMEEEYRREQKELRNPFAFPTCRNDKSRRIKAEVPAGLIASLRRPV